MIENFRTCGKSDKQISGDGSKIKKQRNGHNNPKNGQFYTNARLSKKLWHTVNGAVKLSNLIATL